MFTITGAGNHTGILFVDLEIDEVANTFFNEYGDTNGTPGASQTWEIDEPGYVFGDIYDNFVLGTLDNSNAIPSGLPDDVSMALGYENFSLAAGETASISFLISETAPLSGFYLSQIDPDSDAAVYFSSSFRIGGGQEPVIPEPGTLVLMLTGLALTGGIAAKRSRKR